MTTTTNKNKFDHIARCNRGLKLFNNLNIIEEMFECVTLGLKYHIRATNFVMREIKRQNYFEIIKASEFFGRNMSVDEFVLVPPDFAPGEDIYEYLENNCPPKCD